MGPTITFAPGASDGDGYARVLRGMNGCHVRVNDRFDAYVMAETDSDGLILTTTPPGTHDDVETYRIPWELVRTVEYT